MTHSDAAMLVNGEVFFDPTPKQYEIIVQLQQRIMGTGDEPSNFFLWGDRGGGKSKLARPFAHAMAMACPGLKYAFLRRNMPDLRKNHLIYVGPEMRRLGGDYHETYGQANYANGSIGFYSQCEDARDVEKIVGAEVALLFVDEAPQIHWDHLRTIGPSLRVPKVATGQRAPYRTCTVYMGNMIGDSIDEMCKYFIDKDVDPTYDPEYNPADFTAIEIFLKDNPYLDPVEYRKQFAGIPEHFRKAWIDGVRMDSRTLFDIKKTKDGKPYHYIQELPTVDGVPLLRVPWVQLYRAFDMGYFPDPAVCVWLAVIGRRIIAVREETWFRTIARDLAAKMIETHTELVGDTPCGMTYVDPDIAIKTGSDTVTVMDTLEMAGVPCEASINDRTLYADAIHGLLGEEIEPGVPRLQIYEPGCPLLAKYLPKMRWDEKNPRKMADHKFDHWIVALAYFAISSGVLSLTAESPSQKDPLWMAWMRENSGSRYRRRAM